MANEIKVTNSIEVSNGNFRFPKVGSTPIQIDQTLPGGGQPGTKVIPYASHSGVDLTVAGTVGWLWMKNIDPTNYISWGIYDSIFYKIGKLKPGESACFRVSPDIQDSQLVFQADTANCKVLILLFED